MDLEEGFVALPFDAVVCDTEDNVLFEEYFDDIEELKDILANTSFRVYYQQNNGFLSLIEATSGDFVVVSSIS